MQLSDDIVLALLVLFALLPSASAAEGKEELFVYRRSICTGLGDRIGMLLSLSAAAQAGLKGPNQLLHATTASAVCSGRQRLNASTPAL